MQLPIGSGCGLVELLLEDSEYYSSFLIIRNNIQCVFSNFRAKMGKSRNNGVVLNRGFFIMRKINISTLVSSIILVIAGCNSQPKLRGFYQSEKDVNGYHIQLSIEHDDKVFVEFIDNREVDKGTYEETEVGKYLMTSDKQKFTIDLNNDNSFHISLKKLNDGNPIKMINIGDVPTTFSTEFDDVEEYKALLDE